MKQIPLHMQIVERSVKLITEIQEKLFRAESRDGFIKESLRFPDHSRLTPPANRSSKYFRLQNKEQY